MVEKIYCFFFDTTIPAVSKVTAANETAEPVAGLLSVLFVLAVCELLCAFDELLADELLSAELESEELSEMFDELSDVLSELLSDELSGSGMPSV